MNLEELARQNPLLLALGALVLVGGSMKGAIDLALFVVKWSVKRRSSSDEGEQDPIMETGEGRALMAQLSETTKTVAKSSDAIYLMIQTTGKRDERIGNLADSVSEQTKVLIGISQNVQALALATTEHTKELRDQKERSIELGEELQETNKTVRDWLVANKESQDLVSGAMDSIKENNGKLSELKRQVTDLEKDVRESVLPMLGKMVGQLDTLIESGVTENKEIADLASTTEKLAKDIEDMRAALGKSVPLATPAPAEPPPTPGQAKLEPEVKPAEPPIVQAIVPAPTIIEPEAKG